jgi:hypothetical protein
MPSSDPSPSGRQGTGRIVALLLFGTLVFLVAVLVAPWVWQTLRNAGTLQAWADRATERFGLSPERIANQDGTVHLLYPEQGVVVALDPQGRARPVLQYVAPSEFQRLRAPLLR